MDINTNLRDDEFLFPKSNENEKGKNQASGIIVTALNKRGIQTINDLFNYDQTQFNRLNAHYLGALIQILKYKYLGEELLSDVLLESEYSHSQRDIKKLAKDLRRLGFGRKLDELESFASRFMSLQSESKVTMEQVLKNGGTRIDGHFIPKPRLFGDADFTGFYLDYLEQKRKQDQQEQDNNPSKEVLEGLKLQLQGLVMMRDGLDKQIQDVQNQINALNGGQQTHGRK